MKRDFFCPKYVCSQFYLSTDKVFNMYYVGNINYNIPYDLDKAKYIIILNDNKTDTITSTNIDGTITATFYSASNFLKDLNKYEFQLLECLFLPKQYVLIETIKMGITWDWKMLYKETKRQASIHWNLAKINHHKGNHNKIKEHFIQALRIINFGAQMAQQKKIYNFSIPQELWKEIKTYPNDFFHLKELFFQEKQDLLITFNNFIKTNIRRKLYSNIT